MKGGEDKGKYNDNRQEGEVVFSWRDEDRKRREASPRGPKGNGAETLAHIDLVSYSKRVLKGALA